jgi:MFS family permease
MHEPTQAGLIASLQTLPYLVFGFPAGVLVDRWNRKLVMICCDVARWLAYGSIPLAYIPGHLTVIQLYGVALVSGTAFVFFNIAQLAALPRVVAPSHVSQATAFNTAADSSPIRTNLREESDKGRLNLT